MSEQHSAKLDAWLDLLADVVAERLAQRDSATPTVPLVDAITERLEQQPSFEPPAALAPPELVASPERETLEEETAPEEELEDESSVVVPPLPYSNGLVLRLAAVVCVIVVLINIPLNSQGIALARAVPGVSSILIRNGLLVQEEGSEEIWEYYQGAFRHISSLDAFHAHGYQWRNVHTVAPGFLENYPKGKPRHLLMHCSQSPHFYLIADGKKHWISSLEAFNSAGFEWDDTVRINCDYLRNLPDGESIPPGLPFPEL
jgi:hypothetical protein